MIGMGEMGVESRGKDDDYVELTAKTEEYPKGVRLALIVTALTLSVFLSSLDIVSPSHYILAQATLLFLQNPISWSSSFRSKRREIVSYYKIRCNDKRKKQTKSKNQS